METRMSLTGHRCWKCGSQLYQLSPPIHGWSYHCQTCQHLTSPQEELDKAMAEKDEASVGIVAALSCRIEMSPPT